MLVDCLTRWLSNLMVTYADIEAEIGILNRFSEKITRNQELMGNAIQSKRMGH